MVEQPVAVLKGVNGQIEVYSTKIRIRRKGALSKMTQGLFAGEKDIYINQIASVQVKRAGVMTNGYIKFVASGGAEIRKGLTASTHDENTVIFRRGNQAETVDWIRQYVEFRMAGGVDASSSGAPTTNVADQLRQLAELRDAGLVTPQEFEIKRQELLARL